MTLVSVITSSRKRHSILTNIAVVEEHLVDHILDAPAVVPAAACSQIPHLPGRCCTVVENHLLHGRLACGVRWMFISHTVLASI